MRVCRFIINVCVLALFASTGCRAECPGAVVFDYDEMYNCPSAPCPDLRLDETYIRGTISLHRTFINNTCLEQEGCLHGSGHRTLIKFGQRIWNEGNDDVRLAPKPPLTPECIAEQTIGPWHYSACIGDWRFLGFSRFYLADPDTGKNVTGIKNGICFRDVICSSSQTLNYNCDTQGLSPGCADVYKVGLKCQWIDITGLPLNKTYIFHAEINWRQSVPEITYENNVVEILVQPDTLQNFQSEDDSEVAAWVSVSVVSLVLILLVISWVYISQLRSMQKYMG